MPIDQRQSTTSALLVTTDVSNAAEAFPCNSKRIEKKSVDETSFTHCRRCYQAACINARTFLAYEYMKTCAMRIVKRAPSTTRFPAAGQLFTASSLCLNRPAVPNSCALLLTTNVSNAAAARFTLQFKLRLEEKCE